MINDGVSDINGPIESEPRKGQACDGSNDGHGSVWHEGADGHGGPLFNQETMSDEDLQPGKPIYVIRKVFDAFDAGSIRMYVIIAVDEVAVAAIPLDMDANIKENLIPLPGPEGPHMFSRQDCRFHPAGNMVFALKDYYSKLGGKDGAS